MISSVGVEWRNQMDAEQESQLDEALARARAAFADKSDEQIMEEVAEVIDRVRAATRRETTSQKSA